MKVDGCADGEPPGLAGRSGRMRARSADGLPKRDVFEEDPVVVGPWLLNKVLVRRGPAGVVERAGRIVEVEAYRGQDDPASHAHRGPTPRTAAMFGPPGHLYVYFSYGMHWCANVVCWPAGRAGAVLVRALAPLSGVAAMRMARPAARRDRDLTSGPARMCQALGITGSHDGIDLLDPVGPVGIIDDGLEPPSRPARSGRVGIRQATDRPWRWWVPGEPHVSSGRPAGPV